MPATMAATTTLDRLEHLGDAHPPPVQAQGAAQEWATADTIVDTEILSRMHRGAAWSKLEMCFRWRAIKAYLEANGVEVGSDPRAHSIRGMLRCKRLPPPEYDATTTRVTRLGVCGL